MYPLSFEELRDPAAHRRRYERIVEAIDSGLAESVTTREIIVETGALSMKMRLFQASGAQSQPCCLFFHGGGWTIGGLETHSAWASDISQALDISVLLVDYRLGPENPYPAALDDCANALDYVHANAGSLGIDADRIIVYGDSAGGNLAAALCLRERERGMQRVKAQVLVYPSLHMGEALPSWLANRAAPVLTYEVMLACQRAYLRKQAPDPYSAPLLASDVSGLPPAWILVAEKDPLWDDGVLYAQKLRQAGVRTELYEGLGLVHGCLRVRRKSELAGGAFRWTVDGIRVALQKRP